MPTKPRYWFGRNAGMRINRAGQTDIITQNTNDIYFKNANSQAATHLVFEEPISISNGEKLYVMLNNVVFSFNTDGGFVFGTTNSLSLNDGSQYIEKTAITGSASPTTYIEDMNCNAANNVYLAISLYHLQGNIQAIWVE